MKKELTTLFTGRDLTRLKVIASTNSYLAELAVDKKLAEGSLVMAEEQLVGRGQGGTEWYSEKGKNFLGSFLFYPSFLNTSDFFMLNKAFSLATVSALGKLTGEHFSVKWPNDIYYRYKKVAGILIENTVSGQSFSSCIFGIGLNVNQDHFTDYLPNPVSLKQITGKTYDLDDVKNELCNELESKYLQLKAGQHLQLSEMYMKKLYQYEKWNLYQSAEGVFTGKIIGVEKSGRLIIENENGSMKSYALKEIIFGKMHTA